MLKFIVTRQVPISGEVAIAAVQQVAPGPINSLTVVSYHEDYPENTQDTIYQDSTTGVPIIGYPGTDGPRDYQMVVTDKVMHSNDDTRTPVLLPYQYQLRYDHYEHSSNPSGTIRVCYSNGDEVPGAKYRLERTTDDSLWEDYRDNGAGMTYRYDRGLEWTVDSTTGTVRIRLLLSEALAYTDQTYYVMYNKIRKSSASVGIDTVDITYGHMEVINPELLYTYGNDYSYDYDNRALHYINGGLLPTTGIYFKRSDLNRIRVLPPAAGNREGWFPRVWAGSMRIGSSVYYVPEVLTQAAAVDWSTGGDPLISPRSSFISYDTGTLVNPYTIRVSEWPLYFLTSDYPNYMPYDIYDGPHNALTDVDTNESSNKGLNVYVNDALISGELISDWDSWNGLITLRTSLNPEDRINVSYLYRQLYYTMQVPDMNPQVHHYIPGPSGCSISGYLDPSDSAVITLLPSGGHTYTNELVSWYHNGINPSGTYNGTYYGYSSVMGAAYVGVPDVQLVDDTIRLGNVSYNTRHPNYDATTYDARSRGGGLLEDPYYRITRRDRSRPTIQEESNYYADIGLYDGQGLKRDAILVVTIPLTRLDSLRASIMGEVRGISEAEAHQQALTEVRRIVEGSISAGTYYVIVDTDGSVWPNTLPGR